MQDKDIKAIRPSFQREINRFDCVLGGLSENARPQGVKKSFEKRINKVLTYLKQACESYKGKEEEFKRDFPDLTLLVQGLAKLSIKDGAFNLDELSRLEKSLTAPGKIELQENHHQKMERHSGQNPFSEFNF